MQSICLRYLGPLAQKLCSVCQSLTVSRFYFQPNHDPKAHIWSWRRLEGATNLGRNKKYCVGNPRGLSVLTLEKSFDRPKFHSLICIICKYREYIVQLYFKLTVIDAKYSYLSIE